MATYAEISDLFSNGQLLVKVKVAIVVAATNAISDVAATTAKKDWAAQALKNPTPQAEIAIKALLAQNINASATVIEQADEVAVIQPAVNDIVDVLIDIFEAA